MLDQILLANAALLAVLTRQPGSPSDPANRTIQRSAASGTKLIIEGQFRRVEAADTIG